MPKSIIKDLYYTKDHEWINFQGSVAYVGLCTFKLIGFKEIEQVNFEESLGFKKQGEVIATVKYKDYTIRANMPIDGTVVEVNATLMQGNKNILLQQEEGNAWLVLIVPLQPYERKNLLLRKQYQMSKRNKFTK